MDASTRQRINEISRRGYHALDKLESYRENMLKKRLVARENMTQARRMRSWKKQPATDLTSPAGESIN